MSEEGQAVKSNLSKFVHVVEVGGWGHEQRALGSGPCTGGCTLEKAGLAHDSV